MLDAIEALFFNRSDDPPVFDQSRGGVAVICVDAKNVH